MAVAERIGGRRGPQGPQGEQGSPGGDVGAPIVWGANALGMTGTRYLLPGYTAQPAPTSVKRVRVPKACRAVSMHLTNSTPGFSTDGTGQYTVTLCTVENDVATPTELTMTLGVLDRQGDVTGDVPLSAGQEIAVQVVLSGTITNSPVDSFVTIGFEP